MQVPEDSLIDSRTFLSDVGVWPDPMRLNMEGWLKNFDDGDDRQIAVALLESFVHLNEAQIVHGTISGLRALSGRPEFGPAETRQETWEEFVNRAFISFPSGSATDATGSGHIFGRILKEAGFEEGRILSSGDFVERVSKQKAQASVIFLDDLAATGTQFTRTWSRKVQTPSGKLSLADLARDGRLECAYYAPLVATQNALDKIQLEAATVIVQPVYLVELEYSASASNSRLVPSNMLERLPSFVERYASRSGNDGYGPFGFGGLGLEISFHHSIPNNTLPIFQKGSQTTPDTWRSLLT